MSLITILSYPKINLALDILGKTESGYHEIRTVFHQLGRAEAMMPQHHIACIGDHTLSNQCAQRAQPLAAPVDELIIENSADGSLEINCDNPKVPLDGTNTVLKAADLLKKYIEKQKGASLRSALGAKIFIKKQIPLMSGLGGGASNAVAALKGLGKLWSIHETVLKKLALQIGMDCAFFFDGGTALGEHFGEKITPLPPLPKEMKIEIIETGVEISSHWAYSQIDLDRCGKNSVQTKKLINAIRKQDAVGILENLHNDFEEFVFDKYPQLAQKKRKAERHAKSDKSGRIILCGSGGALMRVWL